MKIISLIWSGHSSDYSLVVKKLMWSLRWEN